MVNVYDKMITVALVSNWFLMLVISSFVNCQVYVSLGSKNFTTNNTEVLITRIEEGLPEHLPSLTCHTDLTKCCRNVDTEGQGRRGEWYYPDGRMVQNNNGSTAAGEGFYRVRNAPQVVRLARRHDKDPFSPTGSYCCVIPTTGGEMTFCINIVVCLSLRLPNGIISYSDPTLGVHTVATHTCDAGYRLNTTSDHNTRTCRSDTSWNGTAVNCLGTESENGTITLAAAFGVLVALVAVVLIVVCLAVVYKKRSAIHQQSHQSPPTKKNECYNYTLPQVDNPVYDEATSTQPNYNSQDPTYDVEAENEATHSYDYIERPRGANATPQFKAANHTPVRREASENDFYNPKQLSEDIRPTLNVQDIPLYSTPARDDASKNGDDFYDAEEHTYSVVNAKCKKKANKKPSEDKREWDDYYKH